MGGARAFSSSGAGSSQGFNTATAASAAAVGLLSLLTIGRGGKKAEARAPAAAEEVTAMAAAPAQDPTLKDRLASLEADVAELIATSKNR